MVAACGLAFHQRFTGQKGEPKYTAMWLRAACLLLIVAVNLSPGSVTPLCVQNVFKLEPIVPLSSPLRPLQLTDSTLAEGLQIVASVAPGWLFQ